VTYISNSALTTSNICNKTNANMFRKVFHRQPRESSSSMTPEEAHAAMQQMAISADRKVEGQEELEILEKAKNAAETRDLAKRW
jgi:hypothetical protein